MILTILNHIDMNKPHKHAELIKAWADGALIEVRSCNTDPWIACLAPRWLYQFQYRVRPFPKLVPFTLEDSKELIGRSVIRKSDGCLIMIIRILPSPSFSQPVLLGTGISCSYGHLLSEYTFLDGSPCGKLEKQ